MAALLCMGPCHGQAHTRDPTIGFSPPALLYFRLVPFSAWCKQCLTFPPFLCGTLNTLQFPSLRLSSYFIPHSFTKKNCVYFVLCECQGDEVILGKVLAGGSYLFIAWTQHVSQPEGQELTFSKCLCRLIFCVDHFFQRTERGEGEMWRPVLFTHVLATQCRKCLSNSGNVSLLNLQLYTKIKTEILAAQFPW